jgi:hypothetical protein
MFLLDQRRVKLAWLVDYDVLVKVRDGIFRERLENVVSTSLDHVTTCQVWGSMCFCRFFRRLKCWSNIEIYLYFMSSEWWFKCNYLNVVSTPYFQFYQLCLAKGFVCEYCKNGDDIIYPFEVKKCTQCPGNVFPACFFLFLACVFSCFIFSPSLTVFHFLYWKKTISCTACKQSTWPKAITKCVHYIPARYNKEEWLQPTILLMLLFIDCGSCYHRKCFVKGKCPKCERLLLR